MKNILLLALLVLATAVTSYSATCVNGQTLAALMVGPTCTVGSSDQWTLSNWTFSGSVAGGYESYGAESQLEAADLVVTFNNISTNGISITYSLAPGSTPFFTVLPGSPSQDVVWSNGVSIVYTAVNGIQRVESEVEGLSWPEDDASLSFKRVITGASNNLLASGQVTANALGASANPAVMTAAFGNTIHISGRQAFDAGSATTGGSITSYTDAIFAADPSADVPEPWSASLTGVGLWALAVLRRRRS